MARLIAYDRKIEATGTVLLGTRDNPLPAPRQP